MLINNNQIKLIHTAKTNCGMTDDEYKDLLASLGVKSSVDLTQGKFDRAMEHFKGIGFRYQPTKRRDPVLKRRIPPESKKKLIGKIGAILADLGLKWQYADAIARNMFKVDVVTWCSPEQLRKVIAALTYHQGRKKKAARGKE